MRSDIRSSSEAPEYEAACSTSPRRLSRRIAMRLSSSVVVNRPVATAALVLRVAAAFLATGRDFRVFAAFFAADFLEADFDFAMSLLPRNPPDQAFTCLSTNSTIRPNMSPHFDKSGDEPA